MEATSNCQPLCKKWFQILISGDLKIEQYSIYFISISRCRWSLVASMKLHLSETIVIKFRVFSCSHEIKFIVSSNLLKQNFIYLIIYIYLDKSVNFIGTIKKATAEYNLQLSIIFYNFIQIYSKYFLWCH